MPRPCLAVVFFTIAYCTAPAFAADSALASVDPDRLARIDAVVQAALDRKELPGAVILIVHRNEVVFRRAYGRRALKPEPVDMTPDTVFDLASLTKPLATATSLMILVEQAKLSLSDRVAKHWPAFGEKGKDKITVEQLLLHTGGLTADNDVADYKDGKDKALERIAALTPQSEPGAKFLYSDIGYIVLGELVERIAGVPLDDFATKNLFDPLGMKDTTYRPKESLKDRIAPTDLRDEKWIQGDVHDPRAFALGGVAGHAGLFSTADDLAIFARTGTSIWIDPGSDTAVIFLSNRLHPIAKGNVMKLRGQVATLAAAALLDVPAKPGRPLP